MPALVTVEGIVIGRRQIGDSGCFIDVLTDEYGVIEATAHGIKKLTSRNAGACMLFSYSKFCFAKTGVKYTLNSAEPKFSFHGISAELEALSLAVYFADVIKDTVEPEQRAEGFLRFMAITLYELDKKRTDRALIKAAFELHAAAMLGFSPDLRACTVCGKYESEKMYFDYDSSRIVCGDCAVNYGKSTSAMTLLSPSLLYALRYMIYSPVDKIYKLETDNETLKKLSGMAEKYLLKQLDRGFRSLDYYKEINVSLSTT